MSDNTNISRQDFEARVIAKAWKDDAFRQQLLQNPKETLEREFRQINPNGKFPDELEIVIVEEKPTTLYLVLPEHPNALKGQDLSDEDLEAVAGGMMPSSNRITCGYTCIHTPDSFALSCG